MGKKASKANLILLLSILGMIGVFVTILSDFILIGKPASAITFFKSGTSSMWDIAPWRITTGAFVGVVVLPFQLLGLIPVYFALKPAGRILPIVAVIANAHTLLMGVAFHISYAYIGSGWRLYYKNDLQNHITIEMVNQFDFYLKLLSVIILTELIFSSAVFIIIVLKGKSLFPKWMAIFNPLGVILIILPIIFLLPYPIGGYLGPACLNIATLIFFIITLSVGYKRIKRAELS